jgi:hypothetical protein
MTTQNTGTVRHGDFYPGRVAVVKGRQSNVTLTLTFEFESSRDQSEISERSSERFAR